MSRERAALVSARPVPRQRGSLTRQRVTSCFRCTAGVARAFRSSVRSASVASAWLTRSPARDVVFQVHSACRESVPLKCPLGQCRVSVLPPSAITTVDADGWWRASKPRGSSPLLVFINSKSGDNQVQPQQLQLQQPPLLTSLSSFHALAVVKCSVKVN